MSGAVPFIQDYTADHQKAIPHPCLPHVVQMLWGRQAALGFLQSPPRNSEDTNLTVIRGCGCPRRWLVFFNFLLFVYASFLLINMLCLGDKGGKKPSHIKCKVKAWKGADDFY